MSTTERLLDTRFAKRLAIVNGLVPAALLLWDAWRHQLGVNDVNFAIRTTGLIGLVFLTLSLVITPLRALTGWHRLIAIRRNLGLLGFFYITVHFAIFFLFDRERSVASTLHEIATRRYLWFGTASLGLMVPLTLTSTDGMMRRLGAARWKLLHRLAYLVAIGGVIHYYLLVKSDTRQPIAFAAAVGVLLLYRIVAHYVGLRTDLRTARARIAVGSGAARPSFWSGELTIARIFEETGDVKTFRLVSPDGGPLPFTHVAGQYLNLELAIDGRRVHRSYTIASSPARSGYCEISVKRTANGYASRYLHDSWREGQRVKVSAPAGKFVFAGGEAGRVVLIAGGIGVTPMMAVVRSLTDRGWRGEIYLLFAVRTVGDVVFRDELAYLEARFPSLHVCIVVSRDPETMWEGARGHVTRELLTGFVPDLKRGPVLLCGPMPMMAAVRELLVGMGVPDADVIEEEFVSPPGEEAGGEPADNEAPLPEGLEASIAFARSGRTVRASAQKTVLEVAEAAGVDIPFECRSGICGTCKTRLTAGRVRMDVTDALTAGERSTGWILACQAHAVADIEVEA